MRREPIELEELKGFFCSGIRLSHRLKWGEESKENEHMMIPSLLAISVVDKDGKPVKSADEWDEWGADFNAEIHELFSQCLGMIGTAKDAKKN